MTDLVECHSDYTYAERPTALTWEGRRLEITAIVRQWRNPAGKGFRVRTTDAQEFDLFYNEVTHEWQIHQP
jgi:hypothetical protein